MRLETRIEPPGHIPTVNKRVGGTRFRARLVGGTRFGVGDGNARSHPSWSEEFQRKVHQLGKELEQSGLRAFAR